VSCKLNLRYLVLQSVFLCERVGSPLHSSIHDSNISLWIQYLIWVDLRHYRTLWCIHEPERYCRIQ